MEISTDIFADFGSDFEVGYMVFIGDFVPAILALLFPSQEWAKISNGPLVDLR